VVVLSSLEWSVEIKCTRSRDRPLDTYSAHTLCDTYRKSEICEPSRDKPRNRAPGSVSVRTTGCSSWLGLGNHTASRTRLGQMQLGRRSISRTRNRTAVNWSQHIPYHQRQRTNGFAFNCKLSQLFDLIGALNAEVVVMGGQFPPTRRTLPHLGTPAKPPHYFSTPMPPKALTHDNQDLPSTSTLPSLQCLQQQH